jgi:hypothetical protein
MAEEVSRALLDFVHGIRIDAACELLFLIAGILPEMLATKGDT